MTTSAKYIGTEGYKLYQKYIRHLRWFGRKISRKIRLFDPDLVFESPVSNLETGSIEIMFPENIVKEPLDPFPNQDVLIHYKQDISYIVDVIKYVAMMKRNPRVEFVTRKTGLFKNQKKKYYKIIIPFEAYK